MRKQDARAQIRDYLAKNGPVRDAAGQATAILREAIAYKGSVASFAQLIGSLDAKGEIARDVKGKRTYSIEVAEPTQTRKSNPAGEADIAGPQVSDQLDYERLASQLLVEVARILVESEQVRPEGSWHKRRVDRLERQNAELETDLSRAHAESRRLSDECEQLKRRLDNSEGNLAVLADRLAIQPARAGGMIAALGADERALLGQLSLPRAGNRISEDAAFAGS